LKFDSPSPKLKSRLSWTPKPYIIPPDMVLVVDTREKKGHALCTRVKGLTICFDTLPHGDYSIRGFENRFAIELKRSSDFFSYIGAERSIKHKNKKQRIDRTKRKLSRLSKLDFAALVVMVDYNDLFIPSMYNSISPETVRGFLVSVRLKYNVHIFMDTKKENIERFILDHAIKFFNMMRKV